MALMARGVGSGLGLNHLGEQRGMGAELIPHGERRLPIRQQPFFPALLATASRCDDAPLGQVVGEDPEATLLTFYSVMARVYRELQAVSANAVRDPGWFWSEAARQRIAAQWTAEEKLRRAEAGGVTTVMDLCIGVEHAVLRVPSK